MFTEYFEIDSRFKDSERPIFLFGAGEIAGRTSRRVKISLTGIFDNNPELAGMEEVGLRIVSPSEIDLSTNPFFIICTTSFPEVAAQLEGMGLDAGRDFVVSPTLNDYQSVSKLIDLNQDLLFTSGFPENEDPNHGGGLYKVEIRGNEWEVEKVLSGTCHGMIKHGDEILVVDQKSGITRLDQDLRVLGKYELPKGSRGHGITYCESEDSFFVAASHAEVVFKLNREFEVTNQWPISEKLAVDGVPSHHINDIYSMGSSVYLSMFSYTGNFRRDVFDGAVVEYDAKNFQERGVVIDHLWMPHNIDYLAGSVTILDSLRGELRRNNMMVVGKFPGFSRGLDYHDGLFYIGQSRNRNFSKVLGVSNNISLDSSIIVFDEHSKLSRTISLNPELSEIHSIRAI